MKLIAFTLLFISTLSESLSQCTGNVSLFSQADVDNFVNTAPCTEISGNLYIGGINGADSDITNLGGLFFLTSVGFSLRIENNPLLPGFGGLHGLQTVGSLTVSDNDRIKSLAGFFATLTITGYLTIDPTINIDFNDSLETLGGLPVLPQDGSLILSIRENQRLKLDFVPFLHTLKRLTVNNNNGPSAIVDLLGFSNLVEVDDLHIIGVSTLVDLNDLNPDLVISTSLNISNNINLNICAVPSVCTYLQTVGNGFIMGNASECVSAPVILANCDPDGDGINETIDNCPGLFNADQTDTDSDTVGDLCDNCSGSSNPGQEDQDLDGIGDTCDNCPGDSNPNQEDQDSDMIGDLCDNCHGDSNTGQEDQDSDTIGDVCDNCPDDSNVNQEDVDSDSIGDLCDNCPDDSNPDQEDQDSDTVGNACDNCPGDSNAGQEDLDSDTIGDVCDNCPDDSNLSQEDQDADNIGDACDNCPSESNQAQGDLDSDTIGDLCDNCPGTSNPNQEDQDADTLGDVCDNCPAVPNPNQEDIDGNGIGDACHTFTGVVEIDEGTIFINSNQGLILKGDDGNCYQLKIDSAGNLIHFQVTCPN